MDQIKMQADKQIKTNKDVGYTIKWWKLTKITTATATTTKVGCSA